MTTLRYTGQSSGTISGILLCLYVYSIILFCKYCNSYEQIIQIIEYVHDFRKQ